MLIHVAHNIAIEHKYIKAITYFRETPPLEEKPRFHLFRKAPVKKQRKPPEMGHLSVSVQYDDVNNGMRTYNMVPEKLSTVKAAFTQLVELVNKAKAGGV